MATFASLCSHSFTGLLDLLGGEGSSAADVLDGHLRQRNFLGLALTDD